MLIIIGKHLKESGETEKANAQFKIALQIINAFMNDFVETKCFHSTIYESAGEQLSQIEQLLGE